MRESAPTPVPRPPTPVHFPLKRWPRLLLAAIHTRNTWAHRIVARLPERRLDRPVFVLGLPRSGTSIFIRLFSKHRDLAQWSEAPVVWDPNWRARDTDHRWTEAQATPEAVRRISNNFAWYTRWKGKPRFANKHPRNCVRVPFLTAGWPDAFLINIQRDPRAVVNSLVERTRAEKWRRSYPLGQFARPPGWREIDSVSNDVEKFSRAIVSMHETLRDDLARCARPEQVLTVRYEDFAEDCRGMLTSAWEFCALGSDPDVLDRIPERLENRNFKWRNRMSADDIRTMSDILSPILVELGYEAERSDAETTRQSVP